MPSNQIIIMIAVSSVLYKDWQAIDSALDYEKSQVQSKVISAIYLLYEKSSTTKDLKYTQNKGYFFVGYSVAMCNKKLCEFDLCQNLDSVTTWS